MADKRLLPSKTDNLADWYTTVIQLADLADYGPTKGTIIVKPYGWAIWEIIQETLNPQFKAQGVSNAAFPLFIPMSFLEKEKAHVEGFAPELAVVTHAGGEQLEEAMVVRPTSETVMYDAYSKWVQSWRDLPVMMNQWCSVVRWNKRTMPFIRTSEFWWQEGHTAHAEHREAVNIQKWAMHTYASLYREYFAMDGYMGWKSTAERFAGADSTLTFESLMPSGKTLQACTSHDLGQNFAKAFNITFQDKVGGESYAWQTSWGISTRSLGGLILAHGDDNGLRLPPKLAPVQVAIVPVKADEQEVLDYCQQLKQTLDAAQIRTHIDARDDETFGFRLNKWEVKGAPLIFKIGAKEQASATVLAKRRDTGEEAEIHLSELAEQVAALLESIQSSLFEQSQSFIHANTREAKTYDEFKAILKQHRGFIKVCWNDNPEIEKKIKEETKAKTSCRPADWPKVKDGIDFYTGKPATQQWLFAQSY
jgi:prolyl-tRNA synthetase